MSGELTFNGVPFKFQPCLACPDDEMYLVTADRKQVVRLRASGVDVRLFKQQPDGTWVEAEKSEE